MPIPITLQINCGYARVAIRELSSPERMKSRLEVAHEQHRQDFLQLFSSEKFTIPEEYRSSTNRQFNKHCDKILDYFSSKWHPPSKRLEYLSFHQKIGNILPLVRWKSTHFLHAQHAISTTNPYKSVSLANQFSYHPL